MATYTYREVLQRIDDITDLIDSSAMEQRLKRLIYKAAIDSMSAQSLITKTNVIVKVVEGLAEKPCDLLRLLRVLPVNNNQPTHDPNHKDGYRNRTQMEPTRLSKGVGYDHDSKYIKPSWVRNGYVSLAYYAVPTTKFVEDGEEYEEVMISYDQLDYCAYEAIRIVLLDEVGRGNINMAMYQIYEQEAGYKFNVAVGNARQLSIDDMESMAWFNRNAQFFNLR